MNSPDTKREILLIEDDPLQSQLLCFHLEGVTDKVHVTRSGLNGVEMIVSLQPSCVLLDLGLPDIDGFEVLRLIRERRLTNLVNIIVLSALKDPNRIAAAIDGGAFDYITKPFTPVELQARVRNALRRNCRECKLDLAYRLGLS